ncbi:la-related protein 1B-like [Xenia sp. Carnegie-2017]|uniref:la-related protein 1B-like n=1 Tax=Xenia sp. Carnegie-2017 TaxID=2897299 RepID=UPI001F034A03|nr:la-related protein 1B-like [Xenia sp. Carnegie-2017]
MSEVDISNKLDDERSTTVWHSNSAAGNTDSMNTVDGPLKEIDMKILANDTKQRSLPPSHVVNPWNTNAKSKTDKGYEKVPHQERLQKPETKKANQEKLADFESWPSLRETKENINDYKNSNPTEVSNSSNEENIKTTSRKKGNRQKWVPLPLDPKGNEGENLNSEDNQYSRRSPSWRGGERSRGRRGAGGIYRGGRGRRGGGRGFDRRIQYANNSYQFSYLTPYDTTMYMAQTFSGICYYDNSNYSNMLDQSLLKDDIRRQIEYYFSTENLAKDVYLRQQMDAEGYIPLSLISSFFRVQALSQDKDLIREAMLESDKVEVKDELLRSLEDPTKWPVLVSRNVSETNGIAENKNAQVVNKPEKETNSDDGTTQLLHVNPEIKGIGISCRTEPFAKDPEPVDL